MHAIVTTPAEPVGACFAHFPIDDSLLRISANVTGDFGSVTDSKPMLCCAGKIVGMMSC
jgi:hypothetical protein